MTREKTSQYFLDDIFITSAVKWWADFAEITEEEKRLSFCRALEAETKEYIKRHGVPCVINCIKKPNCMPGLSSPLNSAKKIAGLSDEAFPESAYMKITKEKVATARGREPVTTLIEI